MGKENVIKSFKAFDKDFKCRDFQYEVGKEYEESDIKVCKKGFHACENPFDVLDHYPLIDDKGNASRFAEVEQSGDIERDCNKVCSSHIKVKAELSLGQFVKACVEWIKEATSPAKCEAIDKSYSAKIGSSGYSAQIGSSGYYAKIGSSGDSAQIGSSGYSAQIGSSGYYAQIGSSGDSAKIGSSGDYAKIGSSGYYAKIGSSGDSAQIGSSGYSAQIGSSGYYAQIGSSGDSAKIGSSGDYAKIGSSGDYAQIGSSGDYAQIGSSGDYAKIGSSGDSAKIGSSGNSAQINSEGRHSVVCCAGHGSKAKAKVGSWITLSEWKYIESERCYIPICVKTERVDGEAIKADTWYMLKNGEFVEV